MKSKFNIRQLTTTAIIAALIIILQTIANFGVKVGPFSLTLALIPIAIGAILEGPLAGAILGLIFGVVTLFDPSASTLMAINPPLTFFYTVILCIFKGVLAGLIPGYIFKLFKTHKEVGVVVASLLVPLINTFVFILLDIVLFYPSVSSSASSQGMNVLLYAIVGVVSFNFLIEIVITSILTPAVIYLYKILLKGGRHRVEITK